MSEPSKPTYQVSAYTVYPSGFDRVLDAERHKWAITVADAGDGWSIRRHNLCLNYRDDWEFEPPLGSRTPEFLQRCRFNEHAALRRARQVVDDVVIAGLTFEDFVTQVKEQAAEKARAVLETDRQVSLLRQLISELEFSDRAGTNESRAVSA